MGVVDVIMGGKRALVCGYVYVEIRLGRHGVRFRSLWSGAHVFIAVRDHQRRV